MNKILIPLAIALSLILAFLAGRQSVPTKIQIQEKYVDRVVERVDTTKVNELTQQVITLQSELFTVRQSTQKVIHTVKHKNGTVETVVSINTNSETNKSTNSVQSKILSDTSLEKTSKQTETQKIVEKQSITVRGAPQWQVSLMAGTNWSIVRLSPQIPYLDPLVLGVLVNRRIVGPVFVGGWVNTSKEFGISLSLEF